MPVDPPSPELFQLDRSTCMALLTTRAVGRLVFVDDRPGVMPVNYAVVDGAIVFRCDEAGHRFTTDPVVFEVDLIDERTRSGWSVVARGPARDMTAEQIERVADRVVPWAPGPKDRWMMITVGEVTGRLLRGAVPSTSDEHGYL